MQANPFTISTHAGTGSGAPDSRGSTGDGGVASSANIKDIHMYGAI